LLTSYYVEPEPVYLYHHVVQQLYVEVVRFGTRVREIREIKRSGR
jgi:hypothetical protein